MVAELNAAIAFRLRVFQFISKTTLFKLAQGFCPRLMQALKIERMSTRTDCEASTFEYLTPIIVNGSRRTIETVKRVIRTCINFKFAEHLWSNGQFSRIMPSLWIDQRNRSQLNARPLKDTSSNTDIPLCLCHVARLKINSRIKI